MTTVVSSVSNSQLTATSSDPVVVAHTGTIDTVGTGLTVSSNANAVVAGTVASDSRAVSMGTDSRLFVAQSGLLTSVDDDSGDGIVASGLNASITIAGTVIANDLGIYATGENFDIEITSTGLLIGGSDNDGQDSGSYSAALGVIDDGRIENHGTIIGEFNPNTGRAIAMGNDFVDFNGNFDGTGEFVLVFINTGRVVGDMEFSAGDDVYRARGQGFVDGDVDMGAGADTYRGADLDDTVKMSSGDDFAAGRDGDDVIYGGSGDDTLKGGRGDDVLNGGNDSDVLIGGRGDDTLDGGGRADIFVFKSDFGSDTILSFSLSKSEKIDLSAVKAIKNFADLRNNHLSKDKSDSLISAGDKEIRLDDTAIGDLQGSDFIF